MNTRLTCVVAHSHVHVNAQQEGGGGGGVAILTCPYILYGMEACAHVFLGVKHTVLIPVTYCADVVVVEIIFRIADQTGRFAQYYDGDIIREVNSKEMKCLVHVVYHQ